jgi:hypothetical protein
LSLTIGFESETLRAVIVSNSSLECRNSYPEVLWTINESGRDGVIKSLEEFELGMISVERTKASFKEDPHEVSVGFRSELIRTKQKESETGFPTAPSSVPAGRTPDPRWPTRRQTSKHFGQEEK